MSDPLGLLSRQTQEPDDQDPLGLLKPAGAAPSAAPAGDINLGDSTAARPTPAPRRASVPLPPDHPAAQPGLLDRFANWYADHFAPPSPVTMNPAAAPGSGLPDVPQETRQVAQPVNRSTVAEQAAAARAQGQTLIRSAASADVSGTPGAQILPAAGGGTTTAAAFDASKTMQALQTQADQQAQFSPQEWMRIAKRGRELASALQAQGKHDDAQDVLTKAYNAELLASGAKQADTFGAIALSNLLGIVKDPYAQQRRNMAEIRANPEATFTPEEQRSMLGMNLPASTERGFDVSKDVAAPLVGMAPLFEAGGFLGRGVAGVAGAAAERAGMEGIGQALGRVARIEEPATALGPAAPVRTLPLVKTRLQEEVAALRQQLPDMLGRGATQGQIVGGIDTYRQARQQGATPEQALATAAEGMAMQVPMGAAAEIGLGITGRLAGFGFDPIARAWKPVADRIRGTRTDEAITSFQPAPAPTVDAIRANEGKLPTADMLPGLHRDIAASLEELLGQRRAETQRSYEDIFAAPHPLETPAGPEFYENLPPEQLPGAFPGERPLGPEEPPASTIEQPTVIGGRGQRQPAAEPIPTSLEAAMRRAGVEPAIRPIDEANAHFRLRRAQLDAEDVARTASEQAQQALNDPNLRLEMAAQAAPGEKQGPLTLAQTLARAGRDADAGEPLAAEYKQAINNYVDAAAAVKDAGEGGPNTRSQIALARAKAALDLARTKYGKQIGASAVLALAANNSDLDEEEKRMVGLGGLAILATDVVPYEGDHPLMERVPFTSRLKSAVDALPKKWDNPVPAADWIGKLKGTTTFKKEELGLILPALEEAQRNKVKLSREDVRGIMQERLPQIERVTLGERSASATGDAAQGDAEDIMPVTEIHAGMHPDEIRQQIDNRAALVQQIEQGIEDQTEQYRSDMQDAEETLRHRRDEAERTLIGAGLHARVLDDAIQYINEHVEGEYVPRGTIERAMEQIQDELYGATGDYEQLLEDNNYRIKEETRHPVEVEWTDADGEEHSEQVYLGTGDNEFADLEDVRNTFAKQEGVEPDAVRATESDPEEETVIYDYNGHEVARASDRDDALRQAVEDNDLEIEKLDELYGELKGDLENYADALTTFNEAESRHYYAAEGEEFDEQRQQIDELNEEATALEDVHAAALDRMAREHRLATEREHRLATETEQRRRLEAAGQATLFPEEGGERPPGEPVAVVPPPAEEETEHEIIPVVHGAPKYASYQRIGGGRDYREMLNVWSNNPGDPYKQNHFGRNGYANVAGHVRAETHTIYEMPGVSGRDIEISGNDPEHIRIAKSHIVEVRKNRQKVLDQMADLVRQHEALAEPEGTQAHDLARKYGEANQRAIDLSKRETQLIEQLRAMTSGASNEKKVAVMIESQSDWSQDAGKYGVKDPEEQARRQAEFSQVIEQIQRVTDEMDQIERDANGGPLPDRWQVLSAELSDLNDRRDTLRDNAQQPRAVPTSPFVETQQAFTLNAARFLLDAAERKADIAAWSDAANRIKNAFLPMSAAKLVYDDITPSAVKRLMAAVGFKDIQLRKVYIRGEGHWGFDLTPEMRKAIKRMGLPLLGAVALTAAPGDAEAEQPGGSTKGGIYITALGGIAAGAALLALAQSKRARRLLKENAELHDALMRDDLSGLANKTAFQRALPSVNADEKYTWVVFDGDRFKKLNDTHGHSAGDRAIQHFGQTIRDVAEQMNIPMRGFRPGGDEFAFAAPVEHAAEFQRRVEEKSKFTEGNIETKLTGGSGPTYDVADTQLNATKEANRRGDPTLRREGAPASAALGGVVLHANPIGPALKELAKYPTAASIAAIGALATQSDDPDIQATGKPLLALAALSAIGSRRIGIAKDFLADRLLQQMQKLEEGTAVARFFHPDALLAPDVRQAILDYEATRAKGVARAAEFSGKAKALGPAGDRAVSDVIENENWEDVSNMSGQDMQAVLTFAAALQNEYEGLAQQKVQTGVLDPLQLLPDYAGPRRYAHYEAADVLGEKRGGSGTASTRIGAQKSRTLDEPIRDAQRALAEAQASGDPQAIRNAQDALDQAQAVQMSQRVERGEIRESSYRAAQGIEKGYADVAAAKLFQVLRAHPDVAHPEWVEAVDDLAAAKKMRVAATTPADRATADDLIRDARVKIDEITRKYQQKGGDYVSLPDTPGLGALRGAVVQRDVANSLQGFASKNLYSKVLRAWKNVKTIFNPGTHAANIISNITFAHMEGLPLWEQPLWLKRAAEDMRRYGPMTRALAENGILGHNAVTAEGAGIVGRSMKSEEGLQDLLGTTRPETADVLRRQGITEERGARTARKRTAKYVLGGAALGAAKLYDNEEPTDALAGAALGAGLGYAASRFGRAISRTYGSEDDIFRIAIGMRHLERGMSLADATTEAKNALGNFRTRSPALQVLRSSIAPFVLYPAKVLPRFASQVVDHPWRYLTLIALWGGLNEYSQKQEGDVPDIDVPPGQRRLMGYFLPGFTQLPMHGPAGERAAVDVGRWTPMSALTTGAPPGSIPAALDEHTPDVFRAGGPVVDLAAKFGANIDPFTQKQVYRADYPPQENIRKLLNDVSGTMLPSALDFHAANIKQDIQNRDLDKLKNDALGPTGLRPRFIRPGANARSATFELQESLASMKQDLQKDLIANKNPGRVAVIQDRYLRRVRQALANYRERLGVEPPSDIVRQALQPNP